MINKHNSKNKEDYWMFKAPMVLKKRFDDALNCRVKNKLTDAGDKSECSYKRLGLALARHDKVWEDIKIADFRKDEK